jgi:hypothetical protein
LRTIRLAEPHAFRTYVAKRADAPLPSFGREFVSLLRREMRRS